MTLETELEQEHNPDIKLGYFPDAGAHYEFFELHQNDSVIKLEFSTLGRLLNAARAMKHINENRKKD